MQSLSTTYCDGNSVLIMHGFVRFEELGRAGPVQIDIPLKQGI
jgi:hypothetical protein